MAYASLLSVAHTIEQIQKNDQYSLSLRKKRQLMSMDKYAIMLQTFLEELPERANSLESRIRDVAYEAEDAVERYLIMCDRIRSRDRPVKWTVGLTKIMLEHRLNKVIKEIDSLAELVVGIMNGAAIKDAQTGDPFAPSSSSSVSYDKGRDGVVGFDDDLLAIKERLCGESSKLEVIPIVGMGGIGKTTLAKKAYNDALVVEHFYIRGWVTVSQDYNSQRILSSLLDSMKGLIGMGISGQNDEEKVYKTLKGRRYLIVLDDMWSTEVWNDLRRIFPDDHNGSRIMLTTRLSDVAADMGRLIHDMRFMDADQSWVLLQKKVFEGENCCPRELEDIGKTIARSCGGLPLAVVVIGGVLSTVSKTQASWTEIEKSVYYVVGADGGELERILSLSYTHLPHHLRPCFLYLAGFPEDYEVPVSNLIKLWVAEGFLKCPSGSKSFEDVAEECLEDLVKRSLVLVHTKKSNGKIKSCGVHDLVRDLCIKKAKQNKFFVHVTDQCARDEVLMRGIKKQHRVSIDGINVSALVANISSSNIRTIIFFNVYRPASLRYFEELKLLRVFHEVRRPQLFMWIDFCDSVFELFSLRYLYMACPTGNISESISHLQNLQTLVIYADVYLLDIFLPLGIWSMLQLRHVVGIACYIILPSPERAASALENLQTLVRAKNLVCRERTMKMIQNLKKLQVHYYSDEDCYLENLVYLHQLESLRLRISTLPKFSPVFPLSLRKLTLDFFGGRGNGITLAGLLPNLKVLKLYRFNFEGGKWETIEGEFCQLNFLLIKGSNLKEWITESSHFPNLKCLLLHDCGSLSEIPDSIGEIPTLELIEVKWCLKLLEESAKQIQEKQLSFGNDALQFSFYEVCADLHITLDLKFL